MADINTPSGNVAVKHRDMGDGSHAEVIAEQHLDINTVQSITVAGTSAQSSAVGATTNRVVIVSTTNCWVALGSNPTAAAHTAGSFYLAAGAQSYPIKVTPGVTKIAIIQDSAGGYASVIESR